jgi:hypothetical protein
MAPLLMHSPDVPANVRAELRAAHGATREHRDEHLARAAHLLHHAVPLDCADALELVGLPGTTQCLRTSVTVSESVSRVRVTHGQR